MTEYGYGHGPWMPGPYGTNLGDIWSGEESDVGRRCMAEKGLVLIHEVLNKEGQIQECVYTVDKDNPRPEMQDLIARARRGVERWAAAQASAN